jgi:peptidylprolyl isomerase
MSDSDQPKRGPHATRNAWIAFLAGVALVVLYYVMTVPGSSAQVVNEAPGQAGGPQIEITIAGEANGKVVVELFDTLAPQHVERITQLARDGAYDDVVFHRVIDGFMAQTGDVEFGKLGGDLRMAGTGGSQYPDLPAEFSKEDFVAGVVGMARSQSPDSANSQFFIMFADAPHLKENYTVVGRVISGMDVVNAIKRGTGPNGAVIGEPDVMKTVRVIE